MKYQKKKFIILDDKIFEPDEKKLKISSISLSASDTCVTYHLIDSQTLK